MCQSSYIARFSYNAVWRCRFLNTFWLLHKKSHATVTHTYRRNQRNFIFKKSPALWKINSCFFTLKLDPTNSFPSTTTQVRHIYLKLTVVFSWNFKDNFATGTQTRTRMTGMTINISSCSCVFHKELMGHIMRKPACAFTQFDLRLCCLLPG